ncbi:MAG: START domain-containing protein [Myxococcales bacterium]
MHACGWSRPKTLIFVALLSWGVWALCSDALAEEPDGSWLAIRDDEGITTWKRERAGDALPGFRGATVMPANVWDLLSVLDDVDRAAEWTANCIEMRRLAGSSDQRLFVYARMDAPWPVRDRDVITQVTPRFLSARAVFVDIRAVPYPALPPKQGMVRIPSMVASYRFDVLSEARTRVEYRIELDAGGTLPDWLKAMVAKDLAHNTLARLRDRVRWASERKLYATRARELEQAARQLGFGAAVETQIVQNGPDLTSSQD